MANKIFTIMKKELMDNLSILKTFGYITVVLLIAHFFISKIKESSYLSLLDLQAKLMGEYFTLGFFLIAGIPFILYLIFLSSGAISREEDKGTFLLIFSRPVKRLDVLFGKFLGIFVYLILINAYILFLFPSLEALFLGLSKSTLLSLYKISIVLFVYSMLLTAFMVSLAFVFSSKFKKTVFTSIVLFVIVLGIFLTPLINYSGSTEKVYPNVFASLGIDVLEGFNLDLSPDSKLSFGGLTGVYARESESQVDIYPPEIVEPLRIKIIPSWLNMLIFLFLIFVFFLISSFLINKKEVY